MLIMNFKNFGKFLLLPTMVLVLSSCNTLDRLSRLGQSPELTNITNPHKAAGYKPISMPMPNPSRATRQYNSLWQEGSRAFFKDQRASEVGDIITVVVAIEDEAQLDNRTRHDRSASDDFDIGGLCGVSPPKPAIPIVISVSSPTDIICFQFFSFWSAIWASIDFIDLNI